MTTSRLSLALIFILVLFTTSTLFGQKEAIVWAQKTELRAEPNMRAKVLKVLHQGDRLTHLGGQSRNMITYNIIEGRFSAPFYEFETETGEKGYAWGGGIKFIDETENEPDITALLELDWDKSKWEMGEVQSPEVKHAKFTFTNTGTHTFTIQGAKPSCGCLKTNWSKEPIKPGETGWVAISFDSRGRAGHGVHKYVSVLWKEGGVAKVIPVSGTVK